MGRGEGEADETYWCLTHGSDFILQPQPEVEAAVQWYAERSSIAAQAFATEVNACVERVGEAL